MTASQLSKQYESVLRPANKPEHEVSQVTSTADKYEVRTKHKPDMIDGTTFVFFRVHE